MQRPSKPTRKLDVEISNQGTIFLFFLISQEAREWVQENVAEPLWFGNALACEARYAPELAYGMITGGLICEPIR